MFDIMLAGVDFGEQGRLVRFHHHHLRFGTHSEVSHEVSVRRRSSCTGSSTWWVAVRILGDMEQLYIENEICPPLQYE